MRAADAVGLVDEHCALLAPCAGPAADWAPVVGVPLLLKGLHLCACMCMQSVHSLTSATPTARHAGAGRRLVRTADAGT